MLRGTLFLAVSQFFIIITNFVLHVCLGRKLGPELYGIFGVITTLLVVNEILLCKGVYETLSKFIAERKQRAQAIVASAIKLQGFIALAAGCCYFLFARQIALLLKDPELAHYIRLFACIVPVLGVSTVYLGTINGLRQFGKQSIVIIVFSVTRVTAVLALVFAGFAVTGAVIGLLLAELVRFMLAKKMCRPTGGDAHIDKKKILGFAGQLVMVAFIASLVVNIDLLAVKYFLQNNLQTGFYTAAVTIAKIPIIFMVPVSLTVLPTLSKSIAEGNTALTEQYIIQSIRLIMMFVLPISLLFLATSRPLIAFLYGDTYLPAALPLNMLLIGGILFSVKVIMSSIIMASGFPRYIIVVGIISLGLDTALLGILVNRTGLVGAASATVTTHLFGMLATYSYVTRRLMRRTLPFGIMKIFLASLAVYVLGLIYTPSGFMLFVYYILLMSVFFGMLLLAKEINPAEVINKLSGKPATAAHRSSPESAGRGGVL